MRQYLESFFVKWLCEYIGKVVFSTHICQVNISSSDMIPNELMKNLNVLCPVVLHQVESYLDSTFVVTKKMHFVKNGIVIL